MALNFCNLGGKLVLVTGAGTGIGQGIAMALAELGADVALHYSRSAEGARAAVAHIEALGRRAIAIQGDLGVVADCRRVVDEAAAFLGGLDGLVNNAGITTTIDFLDVTEEQFDRSYDLNIRGQFFCSQQAVRHMIERGRELQRRDPEAYWAGGSIVNISSVHATLGCPGHSVYAGTKGAINAFTRELAVELLPAHIRANVLAPGTIEVPSYWRKSPGYTPRSGGQDRALGPRRAARGRRLSGSLFDLRWLRVHDRLGALLRRRPDRQDGAAGTVGAERRVNS